MTRTSSPTVPKALLLRADHARRVLLLVGRADLPAVASVRLQVAEDLRNPDRVSAVDPQALELGLLPAGRLARLAVPEPVVHVAVDAGGDVRVQGDAPLGRIGRRQGLAESASGRHESESSEGKHKTLHVNSKRSGAEWRPPCRAARSLPRASKNPNTEVFTQVYRGFGRSTRYSARSASSTCSRAPRRAGQDGRDDADERRRARRKTASWPSGSSKPSPRSPERLRHEEGEQQPDGGSEQAADDGGDDALVADHPPHLAAGRADGAQQPELARALVDRQEERVGDPEQRDHDAHRQQRVEQVDELVELVARSASRYSAWDSTSRSGRRECRARRAARRPRGVRAARQVGKDEPRVARGRDRANRAAGDDRALQQLRVAVDAERRAAAPCRPAGSRCGSESPTPTSCALANCSSTSAVSPSQPLEDARRRRRSSRRRRRRASCAGSTPLMMSVNDARVLAVDLDLVDQRRSVDGADPGESARPRSRRRGDRLTTSSERTIRSAVTTRSTRVGRTTP